jgi:replicative DNA helicase
LSLSCKRSYLQILGCLLKKPELLSDSRYNIDRDDFDEIFHKMIFASINNLYTQGVKCIDHIAIDNYLAPYELQYKIFNENSGIDYITECQDYSNLANFDYSYERMKKFSLLRTLIEQGIDIKEIYDDTLVEPNDQEKMQAKFESYSVQEIFNLIERKIVAIRSKHLVNIDNQGQKAGKGLLQLKEKCKETPDMGIPMASNIMNTIARGARLKKFYLRSAPTGVGKSRLAAGDACSYAVPYIWNIQDKKWVYRGVSEPTLYITTELEIEEIQTMFIAYVSGVEEDKILDGKYTGDEEERVDQAIKYIDQSPLWIEYMSDFNIEDIETLIRQYQIDSKVQYILFDYLHTSMKLMAEISSVSRGMKLREDQILLMFSDRLKAMCNKLNIHIDSSTQTNGEYKNIKDADQNVLRGAKAVADKIDVGIVALEPTPADIDSLRPILSKGMYPEPNLVYHIYKVRRGKLSRVKLWLHVNLGNMRLTELFLTNNKYQIIPIESTKIEMIETILDEHSVDEKEIENDKDDVENKSNAIFTF